MPGDGESSRYHLRGPVKPPSRYTDSGDESHEVARSSTLKAKRLVVFCLHEYLIIFNLLSNDHLHSETFLLFVFSHSVWE